MMDTYDLVVIGGGSGGVRAARMTSGMGAKVALIEERYLGGTCVNVGCVPKKLLVYASHVSAEVKTAAGYGWTIEPPSFDWASLIANKNQEIARLNDIYRNTLTQAGVTIFEGRGRIESLNSVRVTSKPIDGKEQSIILNAKHILIAVGGWPHLPELEGKQLVKDSNDMFFLEKLPKRALILGGGYIAVEFAGILNGLGVDTYLAYRGDLFLRGFDQDIRNFLAAQMKAKGIKLLFNHAPQKIVENSDKSLSCFWKERELPSLTTDLVMAATGRKPMTQDLGLETIGISPNAKGAISVDDHYRTQHKHIFAIGDVIDRVALTPVAIHEAMIIANLIHGKASKPIDYEKIPSAVFSQPPIGTVGLSEEAAIKQYGDDDIVIFKSEFRPMKETLGKGSERCLMKLVVRKSNDQVLGLHMVGADAGEIVQGFAVAIHAGASKSDFDRTIGIHPTLAEEFVTMRQAVPKP